MDPQSNAEPAPALDPNPIPNIVLHPGDTVVFADTRAIRLLDRNGHVYAVLDCDRADGISWRVDTIRFASDFWGRGVLPVRPEPVAVPVVVDGDTVDYTVPVPEPGAYGPAHPIYVPPDPDPRPVPDPPFAPLRHALIHTHEHVHRAPGADREPLADARRVVTRPHAHQHQHAGGACFWDDYAPHHDHVHGGQPG